MNKNEVDKEKNEVNEVNEVAHEAVAPEAEDGHVRELAKAMGGEENVERKDVRGHGEAKKKLSKKAKIIIAIVLGVVVLGGIGVGIWCAVNMGNSEQKGGAAEVDEGGADSGNGETEVGDVDAGKSVDAETEAKREADVKDIVEKMRAALEDYFTKDGRGLMNFEEYNNYSPLYQAEGMIVATGLSRAIGYMGMGDRKDEDLVYDLVKSDRYEELAERIIADNGFEKIGEDWIQGGEHINRETGVICVGLDPNALSPIMFSCGHISWMNKENVALVNELAKAYEEREGYPLGVVWADVNNIKDSEVAPYQKLKVDMRGGYGLFYRVRPDAEWQYFTGGQDILECSVYSTIGLERAFAGEPCYYTYSNDTRERVVDPKY